MLMHLAPINIWIVAAKWLSQAWGGSLWQSSSWGWVPGAPSACPNPGVIFYSQGAASHPPVVARLRGCQKGCVCLFVFPWVASGDNIHHLSRPEAFLSESVGGCSVTLWLWGGVCCGLHRGCVQLGPQQVWACRCGVPCCGFVWLFGGGGEISSMAACSWYVDFVG